MKKNRYIMRTTLRNAALALAALPVLLLAPAACTDDDTDPAGIDTPTVGDDSRLEGDAVALVTPAITRTEGDGTTTTTPSITVNTLHTHLMKGSGGGTYFVKSDETPAAATYIYDATSREWTTQPAGSDPLRVSTAGPYYMRAVAAATRTDDGTQLIAVTGTPAKTSDTGTGGSTSTTGGSVTTPSQASTGVATVTEAATGTGSFSLSLCPLSARLVVVLKNVDGTPVTTAHRPQATIGTSQALKYMALPAADAEKGFQLSADTWPEIAGSTSGSTGSSIGGPAPAKDDAAATQALIDALTVKEGDREEQTFARVDKDGKLLTDGATTDDATGDDNAAPEARLALSNLRPDTYTSGSGTLFTLLCYGDASGKDQQSYTVAATGNQQLVLRAGCTTTLTLTLGPDGELHVKSIAVGGFTEADKPISITSGGKDATKLDKQGLKDLLKRYEGTGKTLVLKGTTISDGNTPLPDALNTAMSSGFAQGSIDLMLTDVAAVSESAFNSCQALQTVSLPAATSIGNGAFYDCKDLKSVSLPVAATIGLGAFNNCTALKSIALPAAKEIDNSAFYNCDVLTSITFGTPIETWGKDMFGNRLTTTNIYLTLAPEQMKMIGEGKGAPHTASETEKFDFEKAKEDKMFCGYKFKSITAK